MTTMIERVARAIYDTWAQEKGAEADWQLVCDAATTTSEKEFPALHETYNLAFKEARAAIEAMREPTDAMVTAGIKREVGWEYGERGCPDDGPHVSSHASYTAMIDAALSEHQP